MTGFQIIALLAVAIIIFCVGIIVGALLNKRPDERGNPVPLHEVAKPGDKVKVFHGAGQLFLVRVGDNAQMLFASTRNYLSCNLGVHTFGVIDTGAGEKDQLIPIKDPNALARDIGLDSTSLNNSVGRAFTDPQGIGANDEILNLTRRG